MAATNGPPGRYHAFLRALEGAFLVHRDGADVVVLNRKGELGMGLLRSRWKSHCARSAASTITSVEVRVE